MKKKRNRRDNTKYPALKPELNLKTRTDLIDYDYIQELPDKLIPHCNNAKGECSICNNPKTRMINPKNYLNSFTEEYTNAKFNHKGKRIQKTKEQVKDSYDRNNSRNRDILTRVKASGKLKDTETIREKDISVMSPEDQLIFKEEMQEKLDLMKQTKNSNNRQKKS